MNIFIIFRNHINKIITNLLKEDDFSEDFRRNFSKYNKYYYLKKYHC